MSSKHSTVSMSNADARYPVEALPVNSRAAAVSAARILAAGSVSGGGGGGSGAFLVSKMTCNSRAGRHCPTGGAKLKANKEEHTVPTFSKYSVTIPMSKVEAAKFQVEEKRAHNYLSLHFGHLLSTCHQCHDW